MRIKSIINELILSVILFYVFVSTKKELGANNIRDHLLRVGFISSDFDIHSVSSLLRGIFEKIDKSRVEIICFATTHSYSWWAYNISESAHDFILLQHINSFDAAKIIRSLNIDILIDLNGHTKNSSLFYLSHRPAPVQISFLGLPSTTSAKFIDYYIGDNIALPPEHRNHFSESLILMQPCYISNDYAQLQGDVVRLYSGKNRAKRKALGSDMDITSASFLFGTISNSQKMDPYIFHVWMNILRRYGGSMLSWTQHSGMTVAMKNLRQYGQYYGISEKRLVLADLAPWLDHLYKKTSVDMFLDTAVKNGHTTGLDGIWAGVPTVTLGGGSSMPTRAGESIAEALGNHVGVTYSLKEYEDFIYQFYDSSDSTIDTMSSMKFMKINESTKIKQKIRKLCDDAFTSVDENEVKLEECYNLANSYRDTLLKGDDKLDIWRRSIEKLRLSSRLFDMKIWTEDFTRLLQAVWDLHNIQVFSHKEYQNSSHKRRHHIFSVSTRYISTNIDELSNTGELLSAVGYEGMWELKKYRDGRDILEALDSKQSLPSSLSPLSFTSSVDDSLNNQSKNERMFVSSNDDLPQGLFDDGGFVLLNIGGMQRLNGWLNVNAQNEPYGIKDSVDIIRSMSNLYGFPNASVHAIYCSHTLEHNGIGDHSLQNTLNEWKRVMVPGGLLLISVPDLRSIFRMYLDDRLEAKHKYMAMMMIYGAQSDSYDYHKIGFDEEILTSFLIQHGFCNIERVGSFHLFQDTSDMIYEGYKISLNMAAKRCFLPGHDLEEKMVDINHNADPYQE